MKIEIKTDRLCKEPKIIIITNEITDEIHMVLKKLSEDTSSVIAGFHGETVEILHPEDIIRIYAASGKVFAVTLRGEYMLKLRLYELETRLSQKQFVRISHSEIVNLKEVQSFDLSFTGTICISLSNGSAAYVSRRYVSKIKQILGI